MLIGTLANICEENVSTCIARMLSLVSRMLNSMNLNNFLLFMLNLFNIMPSYLRLAMALLSILCCIFRWKL